MFSDQEIQCLLSQICWDELKKYRDGFCWKKRNGDDAINERRDNETTLKAALAANDIDSIRVALDKIHRWGFGTNLPEYGDAVIENIRTLLLSFRDSSDQFATHVLRELTEVLATRRLGISRISKWICFVDQSQFAIFDSRVSIALRMVTLPDFSGVQKRAFPIAPRKPSVKGWHPDRIRTKEEEAIRYCCYLQFVRKAAEQVPKWKPVDVEMALFMKGEKRPHADERRIPLRRI